MGQQLGIVAVIDIAAAVEANSLQNHIWLVDNGGWEGSTGEGAGTLASAIDVTDAAQAGPPTLNWLPIGVGTLPITVPQTFFLYEDDRATLTHAPLPAKHPQRFPVRIRNVLGDEVNIKHAERSPTGAEAATALSGKNIHDPGRARFLRGAVSRVAQADDQDVIYYPDPAIYRIGGEAVEQGVIFPAQYGSPELFSDGLYWSATVNPNIQGAFRYTMWITLFYSRRDKHGVVTDHSVTLPHDAWLAISKGGVRSGFLDDTLAIIPVV